ncbi:MAG: Hsp20/alpha crystallin family protein [Methylococcales bacterium]
MKKSVVTIIVALLVFAFGTQVFMFYRIHEKLDQRFAIEKKLDLLSYQGSDTWGEGVENGDSYPYQELFQLRDHVEQLMRHSMSRLHKDLAVASNTKVPVINLITEPGRYVAMVNLSDAIESSLEVALKGRQLTVSIKTESVNDQTNDNKKYQQSERFSGEFYGSLMLPEDVNKEKITTEYHDGVLLITLPKA